MNYDSRLQRLERQAEIGNERCIILQVHDGKRPYDFVEYRDRYEDEPQRVLRADGESWDELKRRACATWAVEGVRVLTVHFPAWDSDRRVSVFSDADYAAIGVASPRVL